MLRISNSKGYTLLEVLNASFILLLMMTAVLGVALSTMRMDRNTGVESLLFTEGMKIMTRVEKGDRGRYGLMKARGGSIVISAGQSRADFSVDTNATYTDTTTDDVAMSIYYDNGDGDDNTFDDNTVILNDGTTLMTLGHNVSNLAFAYVNGVITANLSLTETVEGQAVSMNMSRDIWVRN